MNGYLLDSHIALWWLSDPQLLAEPARDAIARPEHRVFFSAAGAWELAIKKTLGRVDFPHNLGEALRADAINVLDVSLAHALGVTSLPLLHADPFDRLLVSQARSENLTLITRDKIIPQYDVDCLIA